MLIKQLQMQHRKQRKVFRHKLPNLRQPGVKFDHFNRQTPLFFSKINNTLKLLEQPILNNKQKAENFQNQTCNQFKAKKTMSLRVNQLSRPKVKSKDYFSGKIQQKQGKDRAKQRSMSLQNSHNKKQVKRRYSISQNNNKSYTNSTKYDSQKNKQGQIIGSGLASLPLQKILAQRQQYLRKKEKFGTIHTETDSENNQNNSSRNNNQNYKQDFKPQQDFMKWLQKIIGNQGKLYDQYQRGFLQKVNLYQRRRYKISHQNNWK